jgi:hypothetical protein
MLSAATGGHCHSPSVADQTSGARGGLHLAHTTLDRVSKRKIPLIMADGHSAKHTDWNSWLIEANVSILFDFANRNSCLIYGPDSPTTAPYTHNDTPSLIWWLTRISSNRCINPFVLRSARITRLSYSIPHANHLFKTDWTAPRRQGNGLRCFPGLLWRQTSWKPRGKGWGGNP